MNIEHRTSNIERRRKGGVSSPSIPSRFVGRWTFDVRCSMFASVFVITISVFSASAAEPIKVDSVLLTLIEQVEVPAREAGELAMIQVREGQLVKEGTVLAQIDDRDAQLATRKAQF